MGAISAAALGSAFNGKPLQEEVIWRSFPCWEILFPEPFNANFSLCLLGVDEFQRRLPRVKRSEFYAVGFAVDLKNNACTTSI